MDGSLGRKQKASGCDLCSIFLPGFCLHGYFYKINSLSFIVLIRALILHMHFIWINFKKKILIGHVHRHKSPGLLIETLVLQVLMSMISILFFFKISQRQILLATLVKINEFEVISVQD